MLTESPTVGKLIQMAHLAPSKRICVASSTILDVTVTPMDGCTDDGFDIQVAVDKVLCHSLA